ncbi:MAG: undecaprenyl-phosphate glucose phosphotransferase [Dehalococcoidia bacterium]|nr:undecaprenyl-phosphate glucose phosphotransferase [Dehalococcoidia bacterium]
MGTTEADPRRAVRREEVLSPEAAPTRELASLPAQPLVPRPVPVRRRSKLAWTLSPGVLIVTDGLAILAAFLLAHGLRFGLAIPPPAVMHSLASYTGLVTIAIPTILIAIAASGLYQSGNLQSVAEQASRLLIAVAAGVVLTVAVGVFTLRGTAESSRLLIIYYGIFSVALAGSGRYAWALWRDFLGRRGILARTCLVIGTGPAAERVVEHLARSPALGYRIVGFLEGKSTPDADPTAAPAAGQQPVLGSLDSLDTVLRRVYPDELIIADPALTHAEMLHIFDRGMMIRARIRVFPDLFQVMMSDASLVNLQGLPLIGVKSIELQAWQRTVKRWFDVVFASAVLIVWSPFLLLLALLVKLNSHGPALFVQERLGMDGKRFHVIKFRSMTRDAEGQAGQYWTVRDDPRVTPFGRFLRRFSLDEVPQLVNVIVGDMSIVGPRPEQPRFVDRFKTTVPDYTKRLREKAGMTGWAQVNGLRGDISIEERTKYDIYYVEHWSLWLDLKIIFRSVLRIVRDPSAY